MEAAGPPCLSRGGKLGGVSLLPRGYTLTAMAFAEVLQNKGLEERGKAFTPCSSEQLLHNTENISTGNHFSLYFVNGLHELSGVGGRRQVKNNLLLTCHLLSPAWIMMFSGGMNSETSLNHPALPSTAKARL